MSSGWAISTRMERLRIRSLRRCRIEAGLTSLDGLSVCDSRSRCICASILASVLPPVEEAQSAKPIWRRFGARSLAKAKGAAIRNRNRGQGFVDQLAIWRALGNGMVPRGARKSDYTHVPRFRGLPGLCLRCPGFISDLLTHHWIRISIPAGCWVSPLTTLFFRPQISCQKKFV